MLEIWKISMRGGLCKPRRGVTTQPGALPLAGLFNPFGVYRDISPDSNKRLLSFSLDSNEC